MNPDLIGYIALSVQGDGVSIEEPALPLNPEGPTKYRNHVEKGPIEDYSLTGEIFDGKASVEMHTWNNEGKHVDICLVEGLGDGQTREEEVEVKLGEATLRLSVKVGFAFKPRP